MLPSPPPLLKINAKLTPTLRQIYHFRTVLQKFCNMHPLTLKTSQIYVKCTAILRLFYFTNSADASFSLSPAKYVRFTSTVRQIYLNLRCFIIAASHPVSSYTPLLPENAKLTSNVRQFYVCFIITAPKKPASSYLSPAKNSLGFRQLYVIYTPNSV
jgi:hypothetical protein